jgi:hypothetical protein
MEPLQRIKRAEHAAAHQDAEAQSRAVHDDGLIIEGKLVLRVVKRRLE